MVRHYIKHHLMVRPYIKHHLIVRHYIKHHLMVEKHHLMVRPYIKHNLMELAHPSQVATPPLPREAPRRGRAARRRGPRAVRARARARGRARPRRRRAARAPGAPTRLAVLERVERDPRPKCVLPRYSLRIQVQVTEYVKTVQNVTSEIGITI